MENNDVPGRAGATRRAFLSASAVTAVAVPLLGGTALAETDPAISRQAPDPGLRAMLRDIDPGRIKATILKLVSFGTRHTSSSQTDPNRGIGAATDWVFGQLQASAAASGGRMTVQRQSFTQPVASNIPTPTTITNVIATLKGTASPERFYVITGHLDSRVTDVLNFTSDAPGADRDHAVGRRRERRGHAPAGPVRHRRGAVRPDRHEHPGDLAAGPVPARQRPPLVPAAGLAGGQAHRAAGELQPRAP
ncbi:MAG TPA: hypothetical protein VGI96_13995 [Streptosporangiaceae bacterium]